MDWLVGMDLGDRGQGAINFACWLSKALGSDDGFVSAHVLEEAELRQLLRYHHLEELETKAASLAERTVVAAGADEVLKDRRIICGRSAEHALGKLAGDARMRGLIIGRQARRGEQRIVRLGRVARRLLRSLPRPVVVVPPDLTRHGVGDGPVLLAASTEADSAGAADFAKTLARDLGRPLAVAHVIPGDGHLSAEMVPATGGFWKDLREQHERDLTVWMRAHGLEGVPRHAAEGSVVDRLAALARDLHAPLVVCGSRQLGLGMRLFSSSVATDLAAACEVPVAVVPNPTAD